MSQFTAAVALAIIVGFISVWAQRNPSNRWYQRAIACAIVFMAVTAITDRKHRTISLAMVVIGILGLERIRLLARIPKEDR